MPPRSPKVHGRALRLLASLPRLELIQALEAVQPSTVEELARTLGRKPKTLYHHLRPLLDAGLVVEDGEQPTGKRPARLYRLAANPLRFDSADRSPAALEARRKIARTVLRTAERLHMAALEEGVSAGKRKELTLGHHVVRLGPRSLGRVNAKIQELFELLSEEQDEKGRPFVLTVQLAPDRPRRADGTGSS